MSYKTTQIISRCAIVYHINGLYRLLDSDGIILYVGNLQQCEYEKNLKDEKEGYLKPF